MVEGDPRWEAEGCAGGGSAIAGESCLASAGDGRDDPGAVDLTNPVVPGIGDAEVARGIDGESAWIVEGGTSGGATVTEPVVTAAGERGDDPCWVDLSDALVERLGDVDRELVLGTCHPHR